MNQYYKQLCDTTDVMGYISRIDNYDMLHISDYLLQCLGITETGYQGRKCHEVIHGKSTPCVFCNNNRLAVGECDKWYAYNPLLDAHLAVRDTLIEHPDFGKVRMEICYEITGEVRSIQALQASENYDKAVSACAKTLLDGWNTDESIEELLKTLCAFFDGSYSCIIEAEGDFASVTYEYASHMPAQMRQKFQKIPVQMIEDWYEFSDNDDKIFLDKKSQQLTASMKQYQLLTRSKLDGIMIAPLRKGGVKIGSIIVGNPKIHFDDVRLLKTVSAFVVNFIEKQRLLQQLQELSFIDSLTGLKNRNCFETAIAEMKDNRPDTLGVIFCDVNGLKEANDNLGHEYGDVLIQWAGRFLFEQIEAPVYRIGGDEFVVFVTDQSVGEFELVQAKLKRGIEQLSYINLSIGYAFEEGANVDIDKQLITADKDMYAVKQAYYAGKKYNHMNLTTHYNQIKKELEQLKAVVEKE